MSPPRRSDPRPRPVRLTSHVLFVETPDDFQTLCLRRQLDPGVQAHKVLLAWVRDQRALERLRLKAGGRP